MASAGRPFTPELVTALVSAGIVFAPLTLHTGVSSQDAGEPPYPERYLVPVATAVEAYLLFGERVGGLSLVGIAVTALGVALVVAPPRKR